MIERIELSRITKKFGAAQVLRGVSASFGAGLTVIQGANGSGKSTLLGIVGGVIRQTSGTVACFPAREGADFRAEVGWVSHDTLSYADLSGVENVRLAARTHGVRQRAAVETAKSRFGLGDFAGRRLRSNSRGQRQRVALARALVQQPGVLLLDEPTAGLDIDGLKMLVRVISEEAQRGCVVIVVTHEPAVFGELGSVAMVLERGVLRLRL